MSSRTGSAISGMQQWVRQYRKMNILLAGDPPDQVITL
jgi:hypothetical protein